MRAFELALASLATSLWLLLMLGEFRRNDARTDFLMFGAYFAAYLAFWWVLVRLARAGAPSDRQPASVGRL